MPPSRMSAHTNRAARIFTFRFVLFLLVSSAAASWTLGASGRLGAPLGPRLVCAHSALDATLTTATARSRCVSPLLAAAGETSGETSFDYLVIGGGGGAAESEVTGS